MRKPLGVTTRAKAVLEKLRKTLKKPVGQTSTENAKGIPSGKAPGKALGENL